MLCGRGDADNLTRGKVRGELGRRLGSELGCWAKPFPSLTGGGGTKKAEACCGGARAGEGKQWLAISPKNALRPSLRGATERLEAAGVS